MGVRTRWTLAGEPIWNQTHQISGWLWVVGGLIGVLRCPDLAAGGAGARVANVAGADR
jgi:hypothetical protein